jgi:hypothetical protein
MALPPLVAVPGTGGVASAGPGDSWAREIGAADLDAQRHVAASAAKLAASAAITQPGPAQAVRPPANAGPAT